MTRLNDLLGEEAFQYHALHAERVCVSTIIGTETNLTKRSSFTPQTNRFLSYLLWLIHIAGLGFGLGLGSVPGTDICP